MMELSLLRNIDAMEYLQKAFRAFAKGDRAKAKEYFAASNAMQRRAHRHWQVARHGVDR